MKRSILSLTAAAGLLTMAGCSEKFNVAAPYKNVTVVYAFLDMKDTAHYVRVEKGFLDENKSALDMAQNADSNFYSNINVRIERYSIVSNAYFDSIHLNRVDLAAEGYTKQPGTFFTSPNYAYKFTEPLNASYFYRLKITNFATGKTDSADAPIIDDNPLTGFTVPSIDDHLTNLEGLSFFSILPRRFYTLEGIYRTPGTYKFHDQKSPLGIVQAIIRFNWDDVDVNTQVHTPRYYDHDLGYLATNGSFAFSVENASLYNAIAIGMGKAPNNIERYINKCDLTVYGSTPDYNNYRQAVAVQGTGLTGSDISPVYTNVKGENVLGLFTSRVLHTNKIIIQPRTVDSLIVSSVLANAKIKGRLY